MIESALTFDMAAFADKQYAKYCAGRSTAWHYTELRKAVSIMDAGYLEPRAENGEAINLVWFTLNDFWEPTIYPNLNILQPSVYSGPLNDETREQFIARTTSEAGGGFVRFGYPADRLLRVGTVFPGFKETMPGHDLHGISKLKKEWRVSDRRIDLNKMTGIEFMDGSLVWRPV